MDSVVILKRKKVYGQGSYEDRIRDRAAKVTALIVWISNKHVMEMAVRINLFYWKYWFRGFNLKLITCNTDLFSEIKVWIYFCGILWDECGLGGGNECPRSRLENLWTGACFSKTPESWIVAQFLAHKPVNFASLIDSFIVLHCIFSELLKLFNLECKHGKHKTAFRTRRVSGPLEKRDPGAWQATSFQNSTINQYYSTRSVFLNNIHGYKN